MYVLKIKEYRNLRGITQEQLAIKIEISQSFLSEIENKKYDIKLDLLYKIGRNLNVCPKRLIYCNCKICRKKRKLKYRRNNKNSRTYIKNKTLE
ncbi:helix-turn-helix transcriptional regulator [uncultured Clostridium sp.]|uniref:helix-turn-helix transcriptional regulator n=1 Tax=uncultured Clostridium sp. TaxID=59620 RepID=UPI0028E47ADB|nr:helix-turn-helix transcriptional regulator [uncultured Clostridium sp.]